MKSLKYLLRKHLNEMAMDFDSEDRPNPDVERRLRGGLHPLGKVPFPSSGKENQNFAELLASSRYKQLVQKFKDITGHQGTLRGQSAVMPIQGYLMSSVQEIDSIERQHRRELEQLAVKTGFELFGLDPTKVRVKAKITGLGGASEIKSPKTTGETTQVPQKAVELEKTAQERLQKFDLEKAKRRLVNALIQGAANVQEYSSEFFKNRLEDKLIDITGDNTIFNKYMIMMVSNDVLYWQIGDDGLAGMMSGKAGHEQVKQKEDGTWDIEAYGVNFIVLLHEVIKGIMEYLALHSGREDESYKDVIESEDTGINEFWDLRLGPEIYNRYRQYFIYIFQIEGANIERIQGFFWRNIFNLTNKRLLVFNMEILGRTENADPLMKYFFNALHAHLIDDEDMYQENINAFDDLLDGIGGDIPDEDVDDMLRDLFGGIGGIQFGGNQD